MYDTGACPAQRTCFPLGGQIRKCRIIQRQECGKRQLLRTHRQDLQDIQKKGQIVGNDILLYAYRGQLLELLSTVPFFSMVWIRPMSLRRAIALAAVDFDIL